jgi:hypothetical protein
VAQARTRRKVLKRVKMGNGYRWSYGGKLIPETKARRIKAARKLTGTKPRSSVAAKKRTTKKKATPKKRSVRYVRGVTRRKAAPKRRITKAAPKRKTIKRVAEAQANPRRKKVSAATRRKISQALKRYHRGTGTKRAKTNPPKKRRKAVAKKTARRRTTRRRTSTRKPRYGTKAWYRWIGKKGAAARKRKGGTRRRKTTTQRKTTRRFKRGATRYSKQRVMLRRKPYGKRMPHRVRRRRYTRKGNAHYRYRIVKRNPGMSDVMGMVKKTMPIYGGFLAARVIRGLAQTHIVNKYLAGKLPAGVASAAAPALTFLASVFLGPKVLKGATAGKILEGLQLGSLMTTFDAVLGAVLPANVKAQIPGIAGYDDMGVMGMGMGAYMADPTGYSLPPAHATLEPGMGLDVHEAMALDAYVADDGLGLNVEEALADSESDYMQRGGAGGSLAKTVFTY